MRLLTKLPGFTPTQPGFERTILRTFPFALAGGLTILLLPSVLIRLWNAFPDAITQRGLIDKTDIYTFGAIMCYCYLMVAIAIGAIIVALMKGPAYVADAYPLIDADKPAKRQ